MLLSPHNKQDKPPPTAKTLTPLELRLRTPLWVDDHSQQDVSSIEADLHLSLPTVALTDRMHSTDISGRMNTYLSSLECCLKSKGPLVWGALHHLLDKTGAPMVKEK